MPTTCQAYAMYWGCDREYNLWPHGRTGNKQLQNSDKQC